MRFTRRQVFDAAQSSLNTIILAVVDDSEPLVRTVLCRTVANTLSGFVVRKWSQCSAGKAVERKQCVAIFRSPREVLAGSTPASIRLSHSVITQFPA